MVENRLWYEKYRPKNLDEYVWIDEVIRAKIASWIADPGQTPNLILTGLPGTGKTTLALLLPKSANCDEVMFIPASKRSGVDMTDDVQEFCSTGGWGGMKFVIFDEAERLTDAALKILRTMMDEHSAHVRFIFTCNETGAMTAALSSRARTIVFKGLDEDAFSLRLLEIAGLEGYDPEQHLGTIEKIIHRTYPDMRRAIDLMQDCCSTGTMLDPDTVEVDSLPFMDELINQIEVGDAGKIRTVLSGLRRDQLRSIYPALFEVSKEVFSENEDLALVKIVEYLRDHDRQEYPNLYLTGLILELGWIFHKKED